ncbi:MAG: hypothetical protein KY446_07020 [Proteobacteria bacterium]|nr:hypothetical protein [Pseudomonadota bacterium]
MLGQARIEPVGTSAEVQERPETPFARGGALWPLLAAILAGFAAALALAWVLRPRSRAARDADAYPAPNPANDIEEPRRVSRRAAPAPPKVTILAQAGGR